MLDYSPNPIEIGNDEIKISSKGKGKGFIRDDTPDKEMAHAPILIDDDSQGNVLFRIAGAYFLINISAFSKKKF